MMQKRWFAALLLMSAFFFLGLLSGCSSGKKTPSYSHPDESSASSKKGYFARERERKKRYEKEFRNTSGPMNQDHFQVMPWGGKNYSPRSERLHNDTHDTIYHF